MHLQNAVDASATTLCSTSEGDLALKLREKGAPVVELRGRYWKRFNQWFLEPIHAAARLTLQEATLPRISYLGYRAALVEPTEHANGRLHLYALNDVSNFGLHRLKPRRRTQVRKCGETLEFVRLTEPSLVEEQGYSVVLSGLARTRHASPPEKTAYLRNSTRFIADPANLFLAALAGDRMVAYLTGYAVDGIAYHKITYVSEEGLKHSAGAGLIHQFFEICSRSPGVEKVVSGLCTPDNPGLARFKKEMGFEAEALPTKVWLNPLVGFVLRKRRPYAYRRWLGGVDAAT